MSLELLSAENGYIFRITHIDNLPWALENGLHCRSSAQVDPNFVNIGNLDLINHRTSRAVNAPSGGTLSDYVPFYFTPKSIMLYNIVTGHRPGVRRRDPSDIVMMVTRLDLVAGAGIPFAFTDAHGYMEYANTYHKIRDLRAVDWDLLRAANFKTDPEDPGKKSRYQAEALVYKYLPVDILRGFYTASPKAKAKVDAMLKQSGVSADSAVKREWFFG